eukprot:PhF_6_TR699/c0_g1_i1/m.1144
MNYFRIAFLGHAASGKTAITKPIVVIEKALPHAPTLYSSAFNHPNIAPGVTLQCVDTPSCNTFMRETWSETYSADGFVVMVRSKDIKLTLRWIHMGIFSGKPCILLTTSDEALTLVPQLTATYPQLYHMHCVWATTSFDQGILHKAIFQYVWDNKKEQIRPGHGMLRFLTGLHNSVIQNEPMRVGDKLTYFGKTHSITEISVLSNKVPSALPGSIVSVSVTPSLPQMSRYSSLTLEKYAGSRPSEVDGFTYDILYEEGLWRPQDNQVQVHVMFQRKKGVMNAKGSVLAKVTTFIGDIVLITFGKYYSAICVVKTMESKNVSPYEYFFPSGGAVYTMYQMKPDVVLKSSEFPFPADIPWDLPPLSPLGMAVAQKNESIFKYFLSKTSETWVNRACYVAVVGKRWDMLLMLFEAHPKCVTYTDSNTPNFASAALESPDIPPHILQEVIKRMSTSSKMLPYLACALRSRNQLNVELIFGHFNPMPSPEITLNVLGAGSTDAILAYDIMDAADARNPDSARANTVAMLLGSFENPVGSSMQYGWNAALRALFASDFVSRPFNFKRDHLVKYLRSFAEGDVVFAMMKEKESLALEFDWPAAMKYRYSQQTRNALTMITTPLTVFKVHNKALRSSFGGPYVLWNIVHSLSYGLQLPPEILYIIVEHL